MTRERIRSQRSWMRRKMRPLTSWHGQNLSMGGQLEVLFNPKRRQFLSQTKQSEKMLGLSLASPWQFPGSVLPLALWAGRKRSLKWRARWSCAKDCTEPTLSSCATGCPGNTPPHPRHGCCFSWPLTNLPPQSWSAQSPCLPSHFTARMWTPLQSPLA